jgi:hypothetical protein
MSSPTTSNATFTSLTNHQIRGCSRTASFRFPCSSSTSSLDVDEILLHATTGDEHAGGGAPNGSGTPCINSTHHHLNINQRRRSDREGDSPRPHSAINGNGQNPGHITTTTNPYPPQHPSNISYPANQNIPSSQCSDQFIYCSDTILMHHHLIIPFLSFDLSLNLWPVNAKLPHHPTTNLTYVFRCQVSIHPFPPPPLLVKSQFLTPPSTNVHNRHKAHLLPSLL